MSKEIKTYTSEKTGESKTLTEWSKSTGISASTLFCRLKRGMTIDEAIAPNPTAYENITDPVTGKTHSLKEWSEITGISYYTLYTRIHDLKWPIEKVLYGERYETVTRKPRPKSSYKHIDLTGRRFGSLTVLRRADADYVCTCNGKEKSTWKWVCECDCGNTREVIQNDLLNGHCTSCGCLNTNSLIDMTGKTFAHLTVISRAPYRIKSKEKDVRWYCKCDCGNPNLAIVSGHSLRTGHTTSCGCRLGAPTHGKSNHRLYNIYGGMMYRCHNFGINNTSRDRYSCRGIYVCEEWYGYGDGFTNFFYWSLEHGYDEKLSIERINNDGPYAPWNCKWATAKEQANNKGNNIYLTCDGITMTVTQWAEELGVSAAALLRRRKKGWSDEDVIKTPINYLIKEVTSSSGESHSISEWSEMSGIDRNRLYDRIFRLDWNVDRALVTGATNPDIYNHIDYVDYVAQQNPGYYYYPYEQAIYHPAIVYTDIFGRVYTQEEWEANQAVYFD